MRILDRINGPLVALFVIILDHKAVLLVDVVVVLAGNHPQHHLIAGLDHAAGIFNGNIGVLHIAHLNLIDVRLRGEDRAGKPADLPVGSGFGIFTGHEVPRLGTIAGEALFQRHFAAIAIGRDAHAGIAVCIGQLDRCDEAITSRPDADGLRALRRLDSAAFDGYRAALAPITTTDACPGYGARSIHTAAADGDRSAFTPITAADACRALTARDRHRAAADGDRSATRPIAAADACPANAARGLHCATVDGDVAAIALTAAADACPVIATRGRHSATVDGDVAAIAAAAAADARGIFATRGIDPTAVDDDDAAIAEVIIAAADACATVKTNGITHIASGVDDAAVDYDRSGCILTVAADTRAFAFACEFVAFVPTAVELACVIGGRLAPDGQLGALVHRDALLDEQFHSVHQDQVHMALDRDAPFHFGLLVRHEPLAVLPFRLIGLERNAIIMRVRLAVGIDVVDGLRSPQGPGRPGAGRGFSPRGRRQRQQRRKQYEQQNFEIALHGFYLSFRTVLLGFGRACRSGEILILWEMRQLRAFPRQRSCRFRVCAGMPLGGRWIAAKRQGG